MIEDLLTRKIDIELDHKEYDYLLDLQLTFRKFLVKNGILKKVNDEFYMGGTKEQGLNYNSLAQMQTSNNEYFGVTVPSESHDVMPKSYNISYHTECVSIDSQPNEVAVRQSIYQDNMMVNVFELTKN